VGVVTALAVFTLLSPVIGEPRVAELIVAPFAQLGLHPHQEGGVLGAVRVVAGVTKPGCDGTVTDLPGEVLLVVAGPAEVLLGRDESIRAGAGVTFLAFLVCDRVVDRYDLDPLGPGERSSLGGVGRLVARRLGFFRVERRHAVEEDRQHMVSLLRCCAPQTEGGHQSRGGDQRQRDGLLRTNRVLLR
jgi:hypothetical protein